MSKKTQDRELIKINPNCVPFQLQSSGTNVSSSRSPLWEEARKRVQEKGFPISDKRADGLSDWKGWRTVRRERSTAAEPLRCAEQNLKNNKRLFPNFERDRMTNLRDTCWTWGFLRSPASLCSVVQKRLDFISLVAEEKIFIKLYLITLIWNKCGWTDWSFQATVTGPHLWDNIQTAISPGALV